jgi:hypothetical protein
MFDALGKLIFNTQNVVGTLAIWGLVAIIVPH